MALTLDPLLPAQREAVTCAAQPLLLLGAAGTGKTRTIEARFGGLVERGCRPERMLFLTPSTARADASRARLEQGLSHGYDELFVLTAVELAAFLLNAAGPGVDLLEPVLGPAERFSMLLDGIDRLSLERHDFGGSAHALLAGFIRRIDRLKAHLVGAEEYAQWASRLAESGSDAGGGDAAVEQEFAAVYRVHEQLLAEAGARDAGDLIRDALKVVHARGGAGRPFEHVLVDDAHDFDLASATLARAVAGSCLTVAADPVLGFGGSPLREPEAEVLTLGVSLRVPRRIIRAAGAVVGLGSVEPAAGEGEVAFWRCANERAQAQAVAADIERLVAGSGVPPGRIAVLVPSVSREGQAVAVALEERAVPHRTVGETAFFRRAEIRDVLAWLRLLADPTDAPAVVRALARPPVELRSVDIARCTQIARRRKLDMVGALEAAIEAPQVPPEARERIHGFLKLYRLGMSGIDSTRPDLYVHRLIDALGLRRQQLFTAQSNVVERLRALARFGELGSAFARRLPHATPREFARHVAAVADFGLREHEEPDLVGPSVVQVVALDGAAALEADHVYVLGLHAGMTEPAPDPAISEASGSGFGSGSGVDDERARGQAPVVRQALYVAVTRARRRVVLTYPAVAERGSAVLPAAAVEAMRTAVGGAWEEREEEMFGPAETLHSTYRLLRDEVLEGTMRAGGRLAELRLDTDLDVSHAVVRYLELLKLAALIERPEGQSLAEAVRDVNSRILQAVTAEQREIFTSSVLDDYLLDAERDARRRAAAVAARDDPSVETFLPLRGDGIVLSASDIDTYRTCPLKYKFARVFRIPQEPTVHQRFGIVVHQVLERFHAGTGAGGGSGASGGSGSALAGSLPELLGLLEASWRRGGFGDSEQERQLRGKAAAALTQYHTRYQSSESEPLWFERAFSFKLGPHLLRGRVDRVDRLPGGEYELIDYKTGRPKSPGQLVDDVQLSLYAVGAREAWRLDSSQQAYYYVLDDQKVAVPDDRTDRYEWIQEVAMEVANGILSQGFEPTPSFAACSVCDYRLVCPSAEG
ncbi:MAG TPA: ATP-dependent DNA helicase [Solirubrobacteraceae bacterium]|nr:ATP-dependent DNA helicase [Solirubrobacteraceae bacterium]